MGVYMSSWGCSLVIMGVQLSHHGGAALSSWGCSLVITGVQLNSAGGVRGLRGWGAGVDVDGGLGVDLPVGGGLVMWIKFNQ